MSNPIIPPHPTAAQIAQAPRRHHLFGFPIAHSASPAFHNHILQAISATTPPAPTYSLSETRTVSDSHFRALVRDDEQFGGSSVTMPLKVAVTAKLGPDEILDELSDSGKATQTVNTIVVLPPKTAGGSRRMLGTNTDYLGIRHALLRSCAAQNGLVDDAYINVAATAGSAKALEYTFPVGPSGKPYSAFIIGSGGTCRSAVYALAKLGLSPLYLLNRDAKETQDVVDHFGDSLDLRPLRSVEQWNEEKAKRDSGEVGHVAAAVGAIPDFAPQTADEKMVYTLAHKFFSEPYTARDQTSTVTSSSAQITLPAGRPFLDMCYKPRLTSLLRFAASVPGWAPIGGVEAMIEQGLAQARMWAASARLIAAGPEAWDAEASPDTYATRSGDDGPLGEQTEASARALVLAMTDIVTPAVTIEAPALVVPVYQEGTGVQPQAVH